MTTLCLQRSSVDLSKLKMFLQSYAALVNTRSRRRSELERIVGLSICKCNTFLFGVSDAAVRGGSYTEKSRSTLMVHQDTSGIWHGSGRSLTKHRKDRTFHLVTCGRFSTTDVMLDGQKSDVSGFSWQDCCGDAAVEVNGANRLFWSSCSTQQWPPGCTCKQSDEVSLSLL